MDILSSLSQALSPGHRVPRVRGWEGAKAYPVPRDCEVIMLDEDPKVDMLYMKKVDVNGGEVCARYSYTECPVKEFDPDLYLTKDELDDRFKKFESNMYKYMEELIDGFDTDRKSIGKPIGSE